MRTHKRALGTGAVVAIAMVAGTLSMPAQALSGREVTPGPSTPWAGTAAWTVPFHYRERAIDPDASPGRWGGYRGELVQAGVEPPAFEEFPGRPEDRNRKPRKPRRPRPTTSATFTAMPTATATAPSKPTPTVSAPVVPPPPVPPPPPAEPTAVPTVPTEPTTEPTAPAEPTVPGAPTVPAEPTATVEPTATGMPPVPPLPAPAAPGANRSGLPWASGIFARGQGVAGLEAFGAWRGRPADVVVDWPARRTWDDIVNPDWLYKTWRNTPYTKAFGVAPVPEGDAGATLAKCAAGSYNDKWRQFGENIKAAGLDDESIIRLGWEFNGNWYKWSAHDPAQFAQCWRQIVGTVEQIAPALRWDWNVNRGKGHSVPDARLAYPGDAYVDIVGVDAYDIYPGARDEASWQQQYAGPYGLKFWADFAASRGKKLSVAEWGVYPGPAHSGHNGGDNAFYVAKMLAFFRSQGSALAYEAYFNETASYFAGSIFAPVQVPAASAQYRKELAPWVRD